MKVILMNLAATAALAITAVLLVADSGEKGCHQPAQSVTFDVGHNTCGAPGILQVSTPKTPAVSTWRWRNERACP